MYVDGKWVPSGDDVRQEIINPVTKETVDSRINGPCIPTKSPDPFDRIYRSAPTPESQVK